MRNLTAKWEQYRYVDILDLLKAGIVFLPILVYVLYVYIYAINIPRQDDFDAILDFLLSFRKANFSDKLALLFSQHNEHRIFSSRFVYAIYYSLSGSINFRHIILLNSMSLILIFTIITHFIRRSLTRDWYIGAFVLSLCIFDINNVENADFAMAGMQNYGVILLFISAIFFYSLKSRWYLIPAVLMQAMCIFSSGNGNIGAFFIVLFVLLSKDKFKIITALLAFAIFAPLYYYHYNHAVAIFFTLDMAKVVPFFLHVVGAHFSYSSGIAAGIFLLVVLLVTLPFGKKLVIKNNALPLLCLLAFILASMAVMSVFRGNLPVEASYASRYFIYTHLLTSITFVFLLINLDGKKISMPILIVAVIILLGAYRNNYKDGSYGFRTFRNTLKTIDFDYPDKARAKSITDEACKENIYCIDKHKND
jgi:hypothetical protein